MKIVELKIENFGVLGRHGLDFDPGFQLIYGHNEAGKSTLLALIRQWLFGFDRQNVYSFESHSGKMAAEGVVELHDGRRIEFRRAKKDKAPVHGEFLDDHAPISQETLTQLLGNAHRELYQNIFGFSLTELSAGEESIKNGQIHDALFGAGFGSLSQFQQLKDQLATDHGNLFTERGRTKTINKLVTEIKQQIDSVEAAVVKPRQYARLQEELVEAKRQMDQLSQQRDELSTRCGHLQRLLDAWEPWNERRVLQQQIANLKLDVHLPRDIDRQFQQSRERCAAAADDLSDIEQDLREITDELTDLQLSPELLKHASELEKLVREVGRIESIRGELPRTQHQAAGLEASVRNTMQELNPSWNASHLGEFQTSLDQRMAIDSMSQERGELSQQQMRLDREHASLAQSLNVDAKKIEQLQVDDRMDRWQSICQWIADYRNQQETVRELEENLEACRLRTESLQSKLEAPFGRSMPSLAQLPIPLEQTVTEYRERFSEMQQHLQRHKEKTERLTADIDRKRSESNQLEAEHQVPDRQQLHGLRARRDAGWQLIRRKYVNQKNVNDEILRWLDEPDQSLPDTFEQEMRLADEIADRRQAQAEAVARQEHLAREIENLERQQRQAQDELTDARQSEKVLTDQWHSLWADCHLQPQSPQAMLDWLHQHTELVDKQSEHSLLVQKARVVCDKIGDFEDELDEVFPGHDTPIERRLSELQERYQASRDNASQRDVLKARLDEQQESLNQLNLARNALQQQESRWQQRWSELLGQCRFPTDWDDQIAKRVVDGLQRARQQQQEAQDVTQNAAQLSEQLIGFEQGVLAMCHEIASDLSNLLAEQAVVELNRRMDRANQSHQRHEALVDAKKKLAARRQRVETQMADAQSTLAKLLQMAGVDGEDDFFTVAENAEKRRGWSEQVDNLTKQVGMARGPEDANDFEEQLGSGDADDWRRELEEVQRQLADSQHRYEEVVSQHALAQDQLARLDGTSEAARLQTDLESSRAKLAEAVDRWAPFKLASHLLATAIDDFARQHQPAMLHQVESLLSQLTAGRYVRVQRMLDERGTLKISADGQQWLEPAQLSRGTREQLYLAIRLAYIQHYCEKSEPLPIVMDDILVNFDDRRCNETLQVLARLSENWQIIFLTCHEMMVEKVRRILPDAKPIDLATNNLSQPLDTAKATA